MCFHNNSLGRDELQPANDRFTDLFHFFSTVGALQIVALKALFNELYLNIFRKNF